MELTSKQRDDINTMLAESEATDNAPFVVLISCSKSKQSRAAPAAELYNSITFRKSLSLSRDLGAITYILSARYGLVSTKCVLPPYNVAIHDLTKIQRNSWGADIAASLRSILPTGGNIWILASKHYSDPITRSMPASFASIRTPLEGLSIGKMSGWISSINAIIKRRLAIREFYSDLEKFSKRHGLRTLVELISDRDIPNQGLYYFFDASEPTRYSSVLPRIVRIGTHAVSSGSKTTLRTRLRTHLGTKAGEGNHRGSIFRLHVGAAIIARDNLHNKYPNWGKGQTASSTIRREESQLENTVSTYIGSLKVLALEVSDQAGPRSMRAYMERQALALLTQDAFVLDPPTHDWLGRLSNKPEIRMSGLWNIQHVGASFSDDFTTLHRRLACRDNEFLF